MDPALVTATWQSAALAGLSNLLGQAIRCHQANKSFTLNLTDLAHFILFAIFSTPPNFLWQEWLEWKFPAYTTTNDDNPTPKRSDATEKPPTLNIRNTIRKFLLDQTLGATINTLLFIAGLGLMRGRSLETITADCRERFWPLVRAGVKLWPAVSVVNFTLVPVRWRMVVGSAVGVVWGVYLSLVSGGGGGH